MIPSMEGKHTAFTQTGGNAAHGGARPAASSSRGCAGIVAYARAGISRLQGQGRFDAASKLGMYLRKFVAYIGKGEVTFGDFDSRLVRGYHAWLAGQGLGRNTVALYVRNLKRIYLAAVADGLAPAGANPFGGIDVSYHAKKERNRLTPRDVVRLRYMDTGALGPSALFARDVFLFSVVTRGMTGGDIFRLTADSIKGGTLSYTSSLTGRQETVGWTPLMQEIVDRHARPGTPYLFPVITAADPQEQWRQHSVALHNINRNLKKVGSAAGIPFPLTMTVAHHSWEAAVRATSASELM